MKIHTFVIVTITLFSISSCSINKSTKATAQLTTEDLYGKKWKLIELNGKAVPDKVNGKQPFISFEKTDNRYAASGGCNGMGGTFEIKGHDIRFSRGMSTMMACPDMSVESGFRTIFGNTVAYTLERDSISMSDVLIFTKDKIVLAKFSIPQNASNAKLDGLWELDYISGPRIAFEGLFPDDKPTIQFDLEKGRVTGNASCNGYFATVKIEGTDISFDGIGSTKKMCGYMQGEELYLRTLKKVNKFSIQDDQLDFIMDDIAVMRFKKKQ